LLSPDGRNGIRERTLTGPTGPVALALPRATLFRGAGAKEWRSTIVPRYQRRMPEVNSRALPAADHLRGRDRRAAAEVRQSPRRDGGRLKPL